MPYVALYQWLFSPSNPHVARLDAAYRAFEAEARPQNCVLCHSPANPMEMNPLRLLNYPNQALTVRHEIVRLLEQNSMPPPGGIANRAQRKKLIARAKQFAEMGDKALQYEHELKPSERRR
jgi:mono/diheme cytochrome c family protein